MKRILCALLLSTLLLPLVCCGAGGKKTDDIVLPPVREGRGTTRGTPYKEITFDVAYADADTVARVLVGNWLGEETAASGRTFFEAKVLQCYKGEMPESFTLVQFGSSDATLAGYPLFTHGNELLVFLKKASPQHGYIEPRDWVSPHCIVGSSHAIMDVGYDSDGRRYFAERYGFLGKSISAPNLKNDPDTLPIRRQLRAYWEVKDPLVANLITYPYVFAEDDLLPLLKRG